MLSKQLWSLPVLLKLCALGCNLKGFVEVIGRLVQRHDFAAVLVDVSVQPTRQSLESFVGACHCRLSSAPAEVRLGATFPATWDRMTLLGSLSVPGGVSRLGSGNTLSGLAIVVLPIPLLNLPVLSWHVSVGLRPLKTCLLMR